MSTKDFQQIMSPPLSAVTPQLQATPQLQTTPQLQKISPLQTTARHHKVNHIYQV